MGVSGAWYKQVTPFVAYSRLSNFKLSYRDSILWYVVYEWWGLGL